MSKYTYTFDQLNSNEEGNRLSFRSQFLSDLAGLSSWHDQQQLSDSRHARLLKALPEAMRTLTERQKQIIEMRYGRGMLEREIADELGIHVSTVSRTLSRGLDRLRNHLKFAM